MPETIVPPPDDKTRKLPDPAVAFNWQDWSHYLEGCETRDGNKKELVEIVWAIILAFSDLGYEIRDAVDNNPKTIDLAAHLKAAVVQSEDNKRNEKEEV